MSANTGSTYRVCGSTVERHGRSTIVTGARPRPPSVLRVPGGCRRRGDHSHRDGLGREHWHRSFRLAGRPAVMTFLAFGDMVAGGLAQSGSRENHTA